MSLWDKVIRMQWTKYIKSFFSEINTRLIELKLQTIKGFLDKQ